MAEVNDWKTAATGDREPSRLPSDGCGEPNCERGWIILEREINGEVITGAKPCPRCGGAR